MASSARRSSPAFVGFVATGYDAALLLEACIQGHLSRIVNRPDPACRAELASSGHVYIFNETEAGIQRWTDGVKWSPSRVLDHFLIYRQLDEHQTSEKTDRRPLDASQRSHDPVAENQRHLYGSLIDSYHFEGGGLIKKTMSVKLDGSRWRLISYYCVDDVVSGRLIPPSQHLALASLQLREGLMQALACPHRMVQDDISLQAQEIYPNIATLPSSNPHQLWQEMYPDVEHDRG